MTNYAATPASNLQAMINALLPGDVLTLGAGTYSNAAITIAVNGSPTNPITIKGARLSSGATAVIIRTPGGGGGGTQGWKITGSYLYIQGVDIEQSDRGLNIDNASHIKIQDVGIQYCAKEAVWIHNNSHNIFIWSLWAGTIDYPTYNFKQGFKVGTPSASWANTTTPDRTNNVHIFDSLVNWVPGWHYQVCEGAHDVLIEDCHADFGSGIAHRPPAGSADGDGGYYSRGDRVQIVRSWCMDPSKHYFKMDRVTVGGVEYGTRQEIKGGGGRPAGIIDPEDYDPNNYFPGVGSNTNDLKVYENYFDVFRVPPVGYDDTGGVWAQTGWRVPAQLFKKMAIGGPAERYTVDPLPYGQYHLFHRMRVHGDYGTPDVSTQHITYGIEFTVDRPGGRLVGWAFFRGTETSKPTIFRLYDEEYDTATIELLAPKAPDLQDFPSFTEWGVAFQVWIQEWGAWHDRPDYLGIPERVAIVETTKAIPAETWSGAKWRFGYLDVPYDLEANHHYVAGFFFPLGTTMVGTVGWYMGLTLPDAWGRSHGANGISNGPLIAPAPSITGQITGDPSVSGRYNKAGNVTTRYIRGSPQRQGVGFSPPLPGEQMSWPDFGELGGLRYISPIVSYARTVPETVTVTPDMSLQTILDTRIPGDVVIISGLHRGEFTVRESGVDHKPIHLKGDGTARLQYQFGRKSALPALRIISSYIWVENLILEEGAKGILIENGAKGIRVENVEARFVRDEGFVAQEDAEDIAFINCTAHDTGIGLLNGDGFRVGRHATEWILDGHPDHTNKVLIQDCDVYRNFGDGYDICDGSTDVLVKNCTVDFTQGNTPPANDPDGASGFYSRADVVQFSGCTVLGAPKAGFLIFDSTWWPNTQNFGRLQEVKGGSSTGHADAGVVSQSEGCKVYVDFTASGTRVREIEGGWSAAGSSVAVNLFREMLFASVAQHYPPINP